MSSAATERKNQQVRELIETGAVKQALQLCNKRLKKGEAGDYLLVLKAHTLTLLPPIASTSTTSNYEEALLICKSLFAKKAPPVDDVDVLVFLSRVWKAIVDAGVAERRGEDEMGLLWDGAVRRKSGDERLAREWFFECVRWGDWGRAQKAAMHLQRAFAQKREYFFWAVASTMLFYNWLTQMGQGSEIYGKLAYTMIMRAKKEVPPEAKNLLIPARAIQNAQELHLLLSAISICSPAPTKTARAQEALDILSSTNLGLDSAIAKGDYLGLLRKKLSLLWELKKWDMMWVMSGEILRKARDAPKEGSGGEVPGIGDDWALWDGYLCAAGELVSGSICEADGEASQLTLPQGLDKEGIKFETWKTLCLYLPPSSTKSMTRNSELAFVKFSSLFHGTNAEPLLPAPDDTPTLLDMCIRYFDNVGDKNCCFEDLGRYVEMLDEGEQANFLSYLKKTVDGDEGKISTAPQIARRINVQKFIYLLRISPLPLTIPAQMAPENGAASAFDVDSLLEMLTIPTSDPQSIRDSIKTTLTSFVSSSLKIYLAGLHPSLSTTVVTTDNHHGDDAALLAVMALLRLWKLTPDDETPLLRSIILLEFLLSKSKHNYQALLLLTRLYVLSGAPHLAASKDCWDRLNVKQTQSDTLGHWLVTRASTLFPFPESPALNSSDILVILNKFLKIFESSSKQTPEMTVLAFDRATYGQLVEFVEFGERVEGSVSRAIYEVEKRRVGRLRGSNSSGGVHENGMVDWGRQWTERSVVDNRDVGVLVNFERRAGKGESFERKVLRLGEGLPGKQWVKGFTLVEELIGLVGKKRDAEVSKRLREIVEGLNREEMEKDEGREFTVPEKWSLRVADSLAKLFAYAASDPSAAPASSCDIKQNPKAYLDYIEQIKKMLNDSAPSLPSSSAPFGWMTLHTAWTVLEAANLLSTVLPEKLTTYLTKLKPPARTQVKNAAAEVITSVNQLIEGVKKGLAPEQKIDVDKILGSEEDGDEVTVLLQGDLAELVGGTIWIRKVLERLERGRREASERVTRWNVGLVKAGGGGK
ncbi:N-acetyltransferase B complex non catalytic subunit-domain-containing protein [Kalaharituber pfeilii]|nr:N-acetyltransferase B complex non catalytic subunit-domain-containing protein [Kalaharituber pfeilii]